MSAVLGRSRDGEGEIVGERTVRIERLLPGTPERVWAYLTESGKRREWLAVGVMEPHIGGRVEHLFRHHELSAELTPDRYRAMADSPVLVGEVTQWDPPRHLAYTWPGDNGVSEVSFELFKEDGGVRLVVVHRRLADAETMVSVASGWDAHLGILIDRLNATSPRGFWSTHSRLEQTYRSRFAKLHDAPAEAPHGLRLQRIFDAPPARVYDAWTDPALMNEWLGRVEADVRPGGRYRIESDGDAGKVYVHSGHYVALEPGVFLKQTFVAEGHVPNPYLDKFIAMRFHLLPDGRALMDFFNGWHGQAAVDAGLETARQGWSMWFDLLDELFTKRADLRRQA